MPQTKNVEITPGKGEPVVINVSQGDIGRLITLNIKDGSGWFDLTDCSVALAGIKPSGLGFTVEGSVDGHTATIETVKLMTAEYGHIACELKITKEDMLLGTANMILAVERDPHPEGTTDGSAEQIIPALTLLLRQIEEDLDDAEADIETMTQLKTATETAAGNAAASATAAGQSATAAAASKTAAETAKGAAETAQTAAETARAGAEAAQARATEIVAGCITIDAETSELIIYE